MSEVLTSSTYSVVIPAAGVGRRFGDAVSKIYWPLDGVCVIERVIQTFLSNDFIARVVVALHPYDRQFQTLSVARDPRVFTVMGGKTRAASVFSGLEALHHECDPDSWVLVHDAARPFLSRACLKRLCTVLHEDPVGGIVAIPVCDTLKRIEDGKNITATVSREGLWQAQTPQLFRLACLHQALCEVLAAGISVTDEAEAVERLGFTPKVVRGERENRKITYPEDVE